MGDYVFLWKGSVLVSKGCYNKVPQNQWLQTRDVYSFTVRVSRSTRSKFWWGHVPTKGSWHRILSCLFARSQILVAPGITWLVAASLCSLPLSSYDHSSYECLLGSSPLMRIPAIKFRAHPKSRVSSREPEPSAKVIFPSSRSEVPGTC